jgi:hypothetical protein
LLAVSVRTHSRKPLPPMISVAVGEHGSTSTLAGEFPLAQEQAIARAGRQPSTRRASRLRRSCSSSGSSTPALIAARSWRSSLPASWLARFLLLALVSIRPPAAFPALWVSFAAALALALVTPGPSALAGKRTGISTLLIGAAPRHVLPAAASRASAGREYLRRRPTAR